MKARASPGPRGLDSWSSSPTESQYREVGGGVAHVGSHVHGRTRAAMSPGRTASGEEARLVNALRTSSGRGGVGGAHSDLLLILGNTDHGKGAFGPFLIHDLFRSLLNKHFSQPPL